LSIPEGCSTGWRGQNGQAKRSIALDDWPKAFLPDDRQIPRVMAPSARRVKWNQVNHQAEHLAFLCGIDFPTP
jgi:hypothetical protein